MKPLSPWAKIGIVLVGFSLALGLAWLAVYVRQRLTDDATALASSGMYAFGDFVLGVGVFSLLAIVPLSLGLYWLRAATRVWPLFAWCAVLYALTGPLAVAVSGQLRSSSGNAALLSDARIGSMPLSALLLLIVGLFAPVVRSRWMLVCAAFSDGALFGCVVVVHFILPQLAR